MPMNPSQIRDQFRSYFIKTILAITTLYITFGVAGYLSYGQSQKKITDDIIWNIFWTFWMIAGPETNEIITLNLPSDGGFNFAILVKICLCFRCPFSSFSTFLPSVKHKKILSLIFSLFFTYPIMLFPVTSILEKKLEVRMEKYKIQSV